MTQQDQATVELPQAPEITAEQKLAQLVLQNANRLTAEYQQLIKHTGAYMSASMVVAHARGVNDVLKLILKEIQNVQK